MNWTNIKAYYENDGTEVLTVLGDKAANIIKASVSILAVIVALLAILWMLINWFKLQKASNPQEAEQAKTRIKYGVATIIVCICSGVLINIILPLIQQFNSVS